MIMVSIKSDDDDDKSERVFQSKLLGWGSLAQRSEFSSALQAALQAGSCESF